MSSSDMAIDTTAAVAILNRDPAIAQALPAQATLFMPVTVLGELYFGAERSARVAANIARVEHLRRTVTVLSIDAATARRYGRLPQSLRTLGKPLPQNDIWIAACALEHRLPLVTRDSHFQHVGDLTVISW